MADESAHVTAQAATQQYGYVRCYRAVVKECGVSAAYLYGLLEDYAQLGARQKRAVMPSHDHLAGLMGVHRNTILGLMRKLRAAGWVAWEEVDGRPHRYALPVRNLHKIRAGDGDAPAQDLGTPCTETGQGAAQKLGTNKNSTNKPSKQDTPPTPPGGSPTAKPKAKPRTRLPEGWAVSEAGAAYAEKHGFGPAAVERMTEAFTNHHRAKGTTMADWEAAWRTWVDGERKWGRNGHSREAINDDLIQPSATAARANGGPSAADVAAAEADPRRPTEIPPRQWAALSETQRDRLARAYAAAPQE